MSLMDLFEDGYAWTGKRIAAVRPSDLSAPSPCADWNLRQVLNHMLGALALHLDAAAGLPVERSQSDPDTDRFGAEPAAAFAAVAARGVRTWREPGVLHGTWTLPMGPVPGSTLAMLHLTEVVVHGWDVGRATGENAVIPAELAEPALEFSRRFATDAHRVRRRAVHRGHAGRPAGGLPRAPTMTSPIPAGFREPPAASRAAAGVPLHRPPGFGGRLAGQPRSHEERAARPTRAGHEVAFGATTLLDLPIVGDVRGDVGVQLAPPLARGQAGFDEVGQILGHTPTEAQGMV